MNTPHDPLCPVPALLKRGKTVSVLSCDCDLIARVREDERKAAEAMRQACIEAAISNSLQDVAESGEGVIVRVTLGAGRGSVYVNRDSVLAALRKVQI